MKILYGGAPLKTTRFHCYDTSDATMVPSDLHAGVTGWAKGKKIVVTGRAFEFASYGMTQTNLGQYIPTDINMLDIASMEYPVQINIALTDMHSVDFTVTQNIGSVIIDNVTYPLTVQAANNFMTIFCDQTINLQIFYGKDNYV